MFPNSWKATLRIAEGKNVVEAQQLFAWKESCFSLCHSSPVPFQLWVGTVRMPHRDVKEFGMGMAESTRSLRFSRYSWQLQVSGGARACGGYILRNESLRDKPLGGCKALDVTHLFGMRHDSKQMP